MTVVTTPLRVLVLFRYVDNRTDTFNTILHYYQRCLNTLKHEHIRPIYPYVLMTYPSMPTYSLRTPAIVEIALRESRRAQKLLLKLGNALEIKEEDRFLKEGHAFWQTRSLVKALQIDMLIDSPNMKCGWIHTLKQSVQKYNVFNTTLNAHSN